MDICVTTPKSEMQNAAKEAEDALRCGGHTQYFRRFATYAGPKVEKGDRVFYVEDGFIRGFAIVDRVTGEEDAWTCDTTGKNYGPGVYVWMRADSWTWIQPIPYIGFQGFRYVKKDGKEILALSLPGAVKIVGGWMDPKPKL